MSSKRTAIVTGASQGIGAGLVDALLNAGYNVVATSRNVHRSLAASSNLVLVAGDIGKQETATKVVAAAIENFGSIDLLVTNAGIFSTKPFTEFTVRKSFSGRCSRWERSRTSMMSLTPCCTLRTQARSAER